MKLEHTPSKQDVRNKILAQIKAELKHDHRNTHFVTLPAEKWYLEKELLVLNLSIALMSLFQVM